MHLICTSCEPASWRSSPHQDKAFHNPFLTFENPFSLHAKTKPSATLCHQQSLHNYPSGITNPNGHCRLHEMVVVCRIWTNLVSYNKGQMCNIRKSSCIYVIVQSIGSQAELSVFGMYPSSHTSAVQVPSSEHSIQRPFSIQSISWRFGHSIVISQVPKPSETLTLRKSQQLISWSKELAPENIKSTHWTLDVSQARIFPLKEVAIKNILCMVSTFETSQEPMSWLKVLAKEKASFISTTLPTCHASMFWLKDSAL